MPQFFGVVETNLGLGLVFSYITDHDGQRSLDVARFVAKHGTQGVADAFRQLKAHFDRWSIITCDMSFDNFLVRRSSPESIEIVMIDGLGNRDFIPVASYIELFARAKMTRRWKRFAAKLAANLHVDL
jgi:hypothetical protein